MLNDVFLTIRCILQPPKQARGLFVLFILLFLIFLLSFDIFLRIFPLEVAPSIILAPEQNEQPFAVPSFNFKDLPPPPPLNFRNLSLHDFAFGIVSSKSHRNKTLALKETWLTMVDNYVIYADEDDEELGLTRCCPRTSYGAVGPAQQKFKYIPMKLIERFPDKHFYLILDDDVLLHPHSLVEWVQRRRLRSKDLVIVCPEEDWQTWGRIRGKCDHVKETLGNDVPNCNTHYLIPGAIMIFTRASLIQLADPLRLLECLDDLQTLDANNGYPYGGRYGNFYNQDHLFSWCFQVRLGGTVLRDGNAFIYDGGPSILGFESQLWKRHQIKLRECTSDSWVEKGLVGVHHLFPITIKQAWKFCRFRELDEEEERVVDLFFENHEKMLRALGRKSSQ